jgi:drug/metabolite transporter (DMT)-like permease
MERFTTPRNRLWIALATVWITFGAAPVGARIGVTRVPPFLFGGARFVLAGVGLLLVLAVLDHRQLRLTWRELGEAALIGAGMIAIGQGSLSWATTEVTPGVVAVFIATAPLFATVLGRVFLGLQVGALAAVGLAGGIAGTALLAMPSSGAGVRPGLALVMAGGVLAWSAASLFARDSRIAGRPLVLAALQMLIGGVLQLGIAVVRGEPARFDAGLAMQPVVIGTFVYLLIFTSVLGFIAFSWLLRNTSPSVANSQAYVAPVIAISLGWLLLGEPISGRAVLAAGLAIAGVAVLIAAQGRARRPAVEGELAKAA